MARQNDLLHGAPGLTGKKKGPAHSTEPMEETLDFRSSTWLQAAACEDHRLL